MFTFSVFKISFLISCKPPLGDHHGPQFLRIPTTKKPAASIICKRSKKQEGYMKGKFVCRQCHAKFNLPSQLKKHMEEAHPNLGLPLCTKCDNPKRPGEKHVCIVEGGSVQRWSKEGDKNMPKKNKYPKEEEAKKPEKK